MAKATTVLMFIPGSGINAVSKDDVAKWEARGATIVADPTQEELDAEAATAAENDAAYKVAARAQSDADALREAEEAAAREAAAKAAAEPVVETAPVALAKPSDKPVKAAVVAPAGEAPPSK